MADYPPAPWFLTGDLTASAWLVPAALAPVALPGWRPVTLAGRALVGTVHVRYVPPGVLTYDELLAALLVRRGWRVGVTIRAIWVDSAESLAGGRELWAIPKQLARFTDEISDGLRVQDDRGPVADITLGAGLPLPGRWRFRFWVAQPAGHAVALSPVAATSRVALTRTRWRPHGPLAFLGGRRPVAGFALRGFRMAFGGQPGPVREALQRAERACAGWHRNAARS